MEVWISQEDTCSLYRTVGEQRVKHTLRLTWTEGDHGAGLSLDLHSDPVVYFFYSGAGRSSGLGLRTAAAPVAGHRLRSTGPGARGPLGPLAPAAGHWKHTDLCGRLHFPSVQHVFTPVLVADSAMTDSQWVLLTWAGVSGAVEPPTITGAEGKEQIIIFQFLCKIRYTCMCSTRFLGADQLLHPSGASVVSPGSSVRPVLRSRQGQSSLSTQTVPLADRTFPSVQ